MLSLTPPTETLMTVPSRDPRQTPAPEHLDAAVRHIGQQLNSGTITQGAAKALLYSVIETLGVLVGDPDLPQHARAGYEGLLESARELHAKFDEPA
jgi:hypothetical protein